MAKSRGKPAEYTGRWDPELEPEWQRVERLHGEMRHVEYLAYLRWFFDLFGITRLRTGSAKRSPLQVAAHLDVVRRFPPLEGDYHEERRKAAELRQYDLEFEQDKKVEENERQIKTRIESAKKARENEAAKAAKEREKAESVKEKSLSVEQRESRAAAKEAFIQKSDEEIDPEIAEQLQELADGGFEFDIDRDWEWAFNNQALKVMPRDAPSPGAWKILEYARNNSVKFTEKTLAWAEKRRKELIAVDRDHEEDQRTQFKMIDRMERNIRSSSDSVVTELAKQFPAEVASSLRKLGWSVSAPKSEKSVV